MHHEDSRDYSFKLFENLLRLLRSDINKRNVIKDNTNQIEFNNLNSMKERANSEF